MWSSAGLIQRWVILAWVIFKGGVIQDKPTDKGKVQNIATFTLYLSMGLPYIHHVFVIFDLSVVLRMDFSIKYTNWP